MAPPTITGIEIVQFDPTDAINEQDAEARSSSHQRSDTDRFAVRIQTDEGTSGSYVTRNASRSAIEQAAAVAPGVVGRNPLHRERLWNEMKFHLRKFDRTGIGPLDIALWDLAGNVCGLAVHELLGGYRDALPVYAATAHGTPENGLDTPEAYAAFAEECFDRGFAGFKIHTWSTGVGEYDVDRDIELVRAVGDRVGDRMALMLDLSGKYTTLGDALRIGRICDEYGFFWLEDPYGMAALSETGYRRLRERIATPVLQLEHVRGLEAHADAVVTDATDFVRVNPELDGGITGAMKIAHSAESLGTDVEFNGPGPARRQCLAAIRNANFYEITDVSPTESDPIPPFYRGEYGDGLDAIDGGGSVPVPSGPGLGVEYDWEFIRAHAIRTDRYE